MPEPSPSSPPAAIVETHSSVVAFVGDRVYKAKKPVDLGFLDFTERSAREAACHREVELNRRLAPDVYLGVADIVGPDGELCDHLVVMRRMPDERRLAACLHRGDDVRPAMLQIAQAIADLHGPPLASDEQARGSSRDAVAQRWESGFADLAGMGSSVDRPTEDRIEGLARRYLAGRRTLFESRIAQGCIRDGHGDLQADDIFLLTDGPRVLDCLDFDEDLRIGDVLADIGFLAMDLERLGRPDLAQQFLSDYQALTDATWPSSLVHHYLAYRAHVRAKVTVIAGQQHGHTSSSVDDLQALCLRHLERARVRLTLVGGPPGTGKSTVAAALAAETGAIVLRSDEVRRQAHTLAADRYRPEAVDATYVEVLAQARTLLQHGEQVILDATWSSAGHRELARALADQTSTDLVELRCDAPLDLCVTRIEARAADGTDASEATPTVAADLAHRFDPWPEATAIDTTRPLAAALESAVAAWGAI